MAHRFNSPPGWPVPPEGWTPPEGWQPDPSWPAPPADWNFWVDDAPAPFAGAAGVAGASAAPPPPGATQAIPTYQGGQTGAPGQTGWGAGAYPSAPAPYSADPITQPFAAQGAPSYTPGGYAGPGAPAGFTSPGTPPPANKKSKGLLIGVIVAVVAVVALAGVLIANLLGGSDDEADPTPTPAPTTTSAEPTQDATTPEPTQDATSAEPTQDATTAEPTQAPGGNGPAGYTVVELGQPFTALDFDDNKAADVTLNSFTAGVECNAGFDWPAEGSFYGLDFTVTVPAEASEAFNLTDFDFGAYTDAASLEMSYQGFMCSPDNPLPSDIQPGATVSGTLIVDVPTGAIWLTYDPTWGLSEGAAWRIG